MTLLAAIFPFFFATAQIDLSGEWRLSGTDENGSAVECAAAVPGDVHSALLRANLIPDPFWGCNETNVQWVGFHDWTLSREFDMTTEFLAHDEIVLRAEDVDCFADIFVNGQRVGAANDRFIRWQFDVKPFLRVGKNTLRGVFASAIRRGDELAAEYARCYTNISRQMRFEHQWANNHQFVRKNACHKGWDWGLSQMVTGFCGPVSLIASKKGGRVEYVYCDQKFSDDLSHCTLTVFAEMSGGAVVTNVVEIDDPPLWWPAGQGEQPLYTVSVLLRVNGEEADRWEKAVGLRTITVSREKLAEGEEFCFVVNGRKIFAMGADYIPEDNLFGRLTPERTRRLLEDCRLANFNTVRVWGGGYYPSDDFYDACDRLGLLVWQDFMFACAYYDLTEDFENSIIHEAADNLRRLRHHASLALLCGNNEMESFHYHPMREELWQGHTGWYGSSMKAHADYIKMFEYILPKLVRKLAPQVFYWPSSPSSGGSFDNPSDPIRGDVHYWDVWHGEKPFTDYRNYLFRFVSEFGFQSFPCLETVESFTLPEDRNIFSRIMEWHQRNGAANGKIMSYLSKTYLYPKDFDSLLYCSQLLQADAIRYGVEHWRRHRGTCMGAIYWQLNDCWPVASWASLDYYGRWKALHYAARRFFAPVLLSAEEHGEVDQNPAINEFHPDPIRRAATLCLSNESPREVRGTVRWSLRRADGSVRKSGKEALTAPALSAVSLPEMDFPEADLTGDYLSFSFESQGRILSEGSALFCAPKHFHFRNPRLSVRREGDELVVTAAAYAQSVRISSEDPDLLLSDNYFSMNPGEKRVRILRGEAMEPRARSVFDIA